MTEDYGSRESVDSGGTPLLERLRADEEREGKGRYAVLAALADHELVNLHTCVRESAAVEWVRRDSTAGFRVYQQSMMMLLQWAAQVCFPEYRLWVNHVLGGHYFCDFLGKKGVTAEELRPLAAMMRKWIQEDTEIKYQKYLKTDAMELLLENSCEDTVNMLEKLPVDPIYLHTMGPFAHYACFVLASNAGALDLFDLVPHDTGFLLRLPSVDTPEALAEIPRVEKLFQIFKESQIWARIMDVRDVGGLIRVVERGPEAVTELIHINEALQEKNIARVADDIYARLDRVRVILIAGPSSSGKTTFSHRLAIQLRVLGLRPVSISMDDYFQDRDKVRFDEYGEPDFEGLGALDLELFNEHLNWLIEGREISAPLYDFHLGKRSANGKNLKLEERHPVIIEGIHALNDALTFSVDRDLKYKIYISALAQMSIDSSNRVSTTDARLVRRMVRDHRYRSKQALDTLQMWPSVRRGEQANIFPYQEDADQMFNSALLYELGVLKPLAEPLLKEIGREEPFWTDAQRLMQLLAHFPSLPHYHVPMNSILREFIGGGAIYGEKLVDEGER
ncbi:MAG: nucleoside kinase [Peptococcaceae bacterium]|nr:nucleoside kinase [Peptococcaceae bacterium]